MVLSWSKGRVFRRGRKGQDLTGAATLDTVDFVVPTHFRCPITLDLMTDPVTLPTGITYDRDSIEKWLESGNRTCPVTNQPLTTFDIVPNHAIRRMIQEWCVQNRSYGIERIPTPRIPVTHYEVSEVCSKIMSATQRGDHTKCQQLVHKIKFWSKESDRNKKCILQNGAAATSLANAFSVFSNISSIEKNIGLLEEILGVLTWILPKGQESCYMLSSDPSLRCMVWFMNSKDLTSRQNAALVMKQVPTERLLLAKTEGVIEALVKMIKEPVGPSATKASLKVIFQMVSSSSDGGVIKRCVELGLVNLLVEALVDGDRGTCERALGILDCVCDYEEGKEVGKANVLTLPLVVKKILRVSGLASAFGVSILWKLCCGEKIIDEEMVKEALQVGAFQKVLVLLQVGCEDKTKGKATDLLKLLNAHKNSVDCVDSSLDNLKYLKKPF